MNKIIAGVHSQNGIAPSDGERVDGRRLVLFDEVVEGTVGLIKLEVNGLLPLVGVPGFEFSVVGPEVLEDEDSALMSWRCVR